MATKANVLVPETVRSDLHQMCTRTVEMLELARESFRRQDLTRLEAAARLGREIHAREKALIGRVVGQPGDDLLLVPMHLERIGDDVELLLRGIRTMVTDGVPFSERAMREIDTLLDAVIELLECIRDAIPTGNRVLIRHVLARGRWVQDTADAYALVHQQRLIEGVCVPRASSMYLAILDYLRGVERHAAKIAEKLANPPG